MKYICPMILYTCCILAFYFALHIICSHSRWDYSHRLLAYMCTGSGVWSLGFAAMSLQSSPEFAYYCRAFGLIGTFLYLISVQFLICYISQIRKSLAVLFNGFSLLGIPVCLLIIDKRQSVYFPGPLGMTYSFMPGFANNAYTAYSVIIAIVCLIISIYMIHSSSSRRLRFFGKCFLMMIIFMMIGTILDTLLPFLGIPAIPGSTMTQFWGLLLLFFAARVNDRSKISVENISSFIYSSISTPVLVFDPGFRLKLANDAATSFLDIPPALLSQRSISISQLFQVEQPSVFAFSENSTSLDSLSLRNNIYCNLAISRITDRYRDVIGYVIVITDLSERLKTMQKLEEAKLAAEAANRSKSSFLANMSHEIRTPMNAILGFSELLLKMDIGPKVREYVSDIHISCQNLLAVINDILDLSKLDSGKMELNYGNFYFRPLLQDAFHIIDIQARTKGLQFLMEIAPEAPQELYGDKTRLRSILINLLGNAVKYTPSGHISFKVKVLEKTESSAKIQYIISDTGIGLTEEAKAHLFETFKRFDHEKNSSIEGTGLGLAIVNGYVQLMGGIIDVDSVYGKGSTFTVTLSHRVIDGTPLEAFDVSEQEASSLNTAGLRFCHGDVLVADDNQINLKVIRDTLEYYGLKVDTASSGQDAIELCRSKNYDLVFMDQMMPGMDGIEAMRKIRALSDFYSAGGDGKIIVLTANAITGMRKELMDKGFDEYLGKPVNFHELERVLLQFLTTSEEPPAPETSLKAPSSLRDLLPEIDTEKGILQCGGDEALYLNILHLLRDSADEQLSYLTELLRTRDYENYIIHAHSLKGQLLNIGYTELSAAARELEYAAKGKRYEELSGLTDAFVDRYLVLSEQLDNAFANLN